jgi:sarcosine oxidase subunit alpha
MTQAFRLAKGGRIDRGRPLRFQFDGRALSGFAGDTLASALLANGVRLVGRSFKYHRPRGILSAGSEEPNALVTVDRGPGRVTPNLRATEVALFDGLVARSQNRYPSLRFDLHAAAALASPLLSAGFYYKTFMWPPRAWRRWYEPAIRAMAGLGRAPEAEDADRYTHRYAHCDVLVIGAGPAGLAAALGAASNGKRVILCDEQAELGASLLDEPALTIDGWAASAWREQVLSGMAGVATLLPRATAFGWYPDNLIGLCERVTDHLPRERLWWVRAGRVILAAGATERPLVFPGNDRPGVMLAEAARVYLRRHAVLVGRRIVIATRDDSAYRAALDLRGAEAEIVAIADSRPAPSGPVVTAAREAGVTILTDSRPVATSGRSLVRAVRLSSGRRLACDALLMGGGWTPNVHLYAQARLPLRYDPPTGVFLPSGSDDHMVAVGACAGAFDIDDCVNQGFAAGHGSARYFAVRGTPRLGASIPPEPGPVAGDAFVDFQNDVTTRDLRVATREGFRAIEHVKRYTTTGMATDQGRTSNLNAIATVAELTDRAPPLVGVTSFRPPYTPVTFGALAGPARGALFDPVRHAPTHAWAAARGAVFEDVGTWKRAHYFPAPGETMRQAVARECEAVRRGVGLFDASTLGKIEVTGPDAARFLDRVYPCSVASLKVGRCKYAVLLGEDGFIRDDGVIARLAPDRFHITTTTSGAASVLHMLEDYLQTEFTDLTAHLTSITEAYGVVALQGPAAASVMAALAPGLDLAALPHMAVIEHQVAGIRARLFRVSFTGEIGFEINVPTGHTQAVWDAALAAGAAYGITPYGTEAMHVLRAEMGYIIIGQETDGTVVPSDLGLDWTIAKAKRDFVGLRSLRRPDMARPDRKQLVGLLPTDPARALEEGAQILERVDARISSGHVTSAYFSAALGRHFALALVESGRARIGGTMLVPLDAAMVEVALVPPRFLAGGLAGGASPGLSEGDDGTWLVAWERTAMVADGAPPGTTAGPGLTPLIPMTRLVIRGGEDARARLATTLRVPTPTPINRASLARDRVALRLGPDEWLLLAAARESNLAEQVGGMIGELGGGVVDVSHGYAGFEIAGPDAALCLNAFCALDLHPTAFPVGMCVRTLFGKATIMLWRVAEERFHIEVARSFAPYLRACLDEARREFADTRGD